MSSVKTPSIDLTKLSCLEQCRQLYNAYARMLAGGQRTMLRHDNFWVEYRANQASDMERLRELYTVLRNGCAEAQAQLPDISAGNRVRRGGPSTLRILG